ncbi:MAG TPA: protein kinase [Thermoanaerobaculia bacterium]
MIGRTLAHYRIVSKLGEGGMGEVFLAEDTELSRRVALKILAADVAADPERIERFRREAKAVAALNHPNIVTIHSIEESEGIRFLTMERVEGENLGRLIPADGFPLGRLFELAIPLADALAAAHACGIVHRDLKPANIMVTPDGRVKVLDFGLAKLARAGDAAGEHDFAHAPTRSVPLTGEGTILGTAPYMSPEQLQGDPIDHRSDIFSLGVVLYELVSGRRPFAGDSTIELASSILRDTPRPLTELRADVPRHLGRIIGHCLEKDPEARFQSAKDVRNELRSLREEWKAEPPSSAGGSVLSGAAPVAVVPARSSRSALWGGVAAAVALLTLAGIWLARRGGEKSSPPRDLGPKRIAVLPFENLGAAEDGYFADGMTEEVRSKLAGLAGLAVIARSSAEQYRGTSKPPNKIAEELEVRYLLTATVRWQKSGVTSRIRLTPELVELGGGGAPTTRWREGFEADLADVFRVQEEIATRVAKALAVALSGRAREVLSARPTSILAAYDAYLRGQEIEKGGFSPAILRRASAQYEQAVALDPSFALAWARLSTRRSEIYRLSAASPQLAEAARSAAERAVELAPALPEALGALGDYFRKVAGDPEKALEAYARGLRIAPDDALLLQASAVTARRTQEQWEEAVANLLRARDLDPRSWPSELSLGNALLYLRRSGEAREAYDRGLALAPANLSLIHRKMQTFVLDGDLPGARAVLAAVPAEVEPTALVAFVSTYGDFDWVLDDAQRDLLLRLTPAAFDDDRGIWAIVLAQASTRRGDQARVREYAEEARKSIEEYLTENRDDAAARVFLGLALAYLGRGADALREVERSAAQQPTNRYNRHQIVRIQILLGNHEQALDLLEPLLIEPYDLTPGWLRIDPNFDPLRGNPRFETLVRGE